MSILSEVDGLIEHVRALSSDPGVPLPLRRDAVMSLTFALLDLSITIAREEVRADLQAKEAASAPAFIAGEAAPDPTPAASASATASATAATTGEATVHDITSPSECMTQQFDPETGAPTAGPTEPTVTAGSPGSGATTAGSATAAASAEAAPAQPAPAVDQFGVAPATVVHYPILALPVTDSMAPAAPAASEYAPAAEPAPAEPGTAQ